VFYYRRLMLLLLVEANYSNIIRIKIKLLTHGTRYRMIIDWKFCGMWLRLGSFSLLIGISGKMAFAVPVAQVKKCKAHEADISKAIGLGSGLTVVPEGVHFGKINRRQSGDTVLEFLAISDRGPNVSGPKVASGTALIPSKVFSEPEYAPRFGVIACTGGRYVVQSEVKLRSVGGDPLGGLPPAKLLSLPGLTPLAGEVLEESLTPDLRRIAPAGEGVDPEGIAVGSDGSLWIVDEYGPSILHVDSKGKVLRRWYPGEGLPLWLRTMQPNRGFEGIAILPGSGDIIVSMQSPRVASSGGAFGYIDLIRLSPEGEYLGYYQWALQMKSPADFAEVKIGDIAAVSADSLIATRAFRSSVTVEQIDGLKPFIRRQASKETETEGEFKTVSSHTVVNLTSLGWKKDKTEGLTVLPDGKTIVVMNDDDFAVKGRLDIKPDQMVLRGDGMLQTEAPVKVEVTHKSSSAGPELWFIELEKSIVG
jgi:hypothetical protein